jgi:outer membrane protein assembly factor BamB
VAIDGYNADYWQMYPTPQRLGTPSLAGVDAGMHYDASTGALYAISGGTFTRYESAYLYRIDPDTGSSTLIGYDLDHYAQSLAISPTGDAIAIDGVFENLLYHVDIETGQLTPGPRIRSPYGSSLFIGSGMAYAPDGTLWITDAFTGRIYRLNPTTGVATHVSTIDVHPSGGWPWQFLAIPVPEPSSLSMLLLGVLLVRRGSGSRVPAREQRRRA